MWGGALKALVGLSRAFTHDRAMGRQISYSHLLSLGFDAATQTATPSWETVSLQAIPGPDIILGGEPGQEQLWFLVAQDDLGLTPRPGDRIVWQGNNYRVVQYQADRAGACYKIEVEPA